MYVSVAVSNQMQQSGCRSTRYVLAMKSNIYRVVITGWWVVQRIVSIGWWRGGQGSVNNGDYLMMWSKIIYVVIERRLLDG